MMFRRKYLIYVFLVLALGLQACSRSEIQMPSRIEEAGIPAEDFVLKDLDGRSVSLKSFEEKSPVLLVFWATWCGFCQEEIPKIVRLRNKYSSDELAILGIDLQEPRGYVRAFAEKFGINYPILLDEDAKVAIRYGIYSVPTFLLVDRQGSVIAYDNRLSPAVLSLIDDIV